MTGISLLFRSKRKRDRDRKQEEQHIQFASLPLAADLGNPISNSMTSSRRQSQFYSPPREGPPAYGTPIPRYDPSQYRNLDRPSSDMAMNRYSVGPSVLYPGHYPDVRRSLPPPPPVGNRLTAQRLSTGMSTDRRRQSVMPTFADPPVFSRWRQPPVRSDDTDNSNSRTSRSGKATESGTSHQNDGGVRRPGRTKPVLSRLITDLR